MDTRSQNRKKKNISYKKMFKSINEFIEPHLGKVPIYFSTQGCVLAMILLVYVIKVVHVLLSYLLTMKYDLVQASYRGGAKEGQKPTFGEKMVQRAYNAHANSFEAFSVFTAAVLIALHTVGDSERLRLLANAFVLVRAAYAAIYVFAFHTVLTPLRSGAFFVGLNLCFMIFLHALGEEWKFF
jgi:uncharacterized MAPEG superfamily protein